MLCEYGPRLDNSPYDSFRELKEGLQQQRVAKNETSISKLRYAIQTIKEENLTLKAQITKVKEDASNKERTLLRKIMQMTEQVEINKAAIDNHRQKHTVTNTLTYTEAQPRPLSTHNTHLRSQTNHNTHHTMITKHHMHLVLSNTVDNMFCIFRLAAYGLVLKIGTCAKHTRAKHLVCPLEQSLCICDVHIK